LKGGKLPNRLESYANVKLAENGFMLAPALVTGQMPNIARRSVRDVQNMLAAKSGKRVCDGRAR